MRIGIDLDNTIVCYDTLFHRVATEQDLVPSATPPTKLAVRDHLRAVQKEEAWTEMQGQVYGNRMDEAGAFPGVVEFLHWARARPVSVCIISHRTLHPFLGARYDLHQAARAWVETHLVDELGPLVSPDRVFVELTKDAKLHRIAAAGCDWFIDDLPEILRASAFPPAASPILFDPDAHHAIDHEVLTMVNWSDIRRFFERQCSSKN